MSRTLSDRAPARPVVQREKSRQRDGAAAAALWPRPYGIELADRVAAKSAAAGGLPAQLKAGIEGLSGLDVGAARVHFNSTEPRRLDAQAFTRGLDIHLAPGQERHLPHEAWHVVQQAQGRVSATASLAGTRVNDDPALEGEADRMGARAASAGRAPTDERSADGPPADASASHAPAARISQPVVQGYFNGRSGANRWRIADDLQMAIRQDSPVYGSRYFYADAALIGTTNTQLGKAGSRLVLKAGSGSMKVSDGTQTQSLTRVVPSNKQDSSTGNARKSGMQWPEDCGLAANAVMQGDVLKTRAVYSRKRLGRQVKKSGPSREYGKDSATYKGSTLHTPHLMLDDILAATLDPDVAKAWQKYMAMSAAEKDRFDKSAGINKYAAPQVGEAFSIVSNKDELVGGKSAWNFHWGGIAMRSDGDFVTMENFAGSGTDAWDFQMYGPASKAGQTFHEQQKQRKHGALDEYGPNPTTIRAQRD